MTAWTVGTGWTLVGIATATTFVLAAVKVSKWWKRQPDLIARALTETGIQPEPAPVTCTQRGCTGHGLWFARTEGEEKLRRVCWSCYQVGVVKGWWAEFGNSEPYDRELDADDWQAWESECSGGAA